MSSLIRKLELYGVFYFSALALIFGGTHFLLFHIVWDQTYVRLGFLRLPMNGISVLTGTLLFLVWLGWYLWYLANEVYYDKTRRDFKMDYIRYRRNWFEMLAYFRAADPNRLDIEALPITRWEDVDGIPLAVANEDRLFFQPSTAEGNIAVISIPGGGKTSSICIPAAKRFNASRGGGGVFALDIKGDLLNAVRGSRRVRIFAPADPEHSLHYNPFFGIPEMSDRDRRIFLKNMAYTIVEDDPGDNGQYFVEGARDYFRSIAIYLITKNPRISFPAVVNAILHGNAIDWVMEIRESGIDPAKITLDRRYGENEKNLAGCYSHLAGSLEGFYDFAEVLDGQGDCISFDDLSHGYDIYIEIPQGYQDVLAPVASMITQNFLSACYSRPDKTTPGGKEVCNILFLLDEFAKLRFDYRTIETALSTLRSKKVTILMAYQSQAQLQKAFGDVGARAIMDCISTVAFISATDNMSRRYMSEMIGSRNVYKVTTSSSGFRSSSRTISEAKEPVIPPENLGNLGDNILIYANGKYLKGRKTVVYHRTSCKTPGGSVGVKDLRNKFGV